MEINQNLNQDIDNTAMDEIAPKDLSFDSKPTTPDQEAVMKQPSEPVSTSGEKAGIGARFTAFFIDWFLVTSVVGLLGSLFGFGSVGMVDGSYSANVSGWGSLLVFAYFIVMDVMFGGPLGKMIFKIKVVDSSTGENLTWGKAILREFVGRFLSGIVLGLGYLWALWDKDKQSWHDKIAKSYVVKK